MDTHIFVRRTLYLALVFFLLAVFSNRTSADITFPEACADCHGPTPEYQIKGAQMQHQESGHYLGFDKHGTHAWYANGDGCQQCHTHEGFVEFIETGELQSDYVMWPSQPGCFTCHDPHATGDFSLRTSTPVTLVTGAEIDLHSGNLCANCHQSRRSPTEVVVATPAAEVSAYFGPHHGPQANLFAGTGAYEFSGKLYTNSQHRVEVENACIGCHMALPEGRYRSTPALGGHSFFIADEDHSGNVRLSTASCEGCHAGIKQAKDSPYFNTPSADDYDGDGYVEAAQMEVEGLLNLLVNAEGTGLLQSGPNAFYTADGQWNRVRNSEIVRSELEMAALFNYKFFVEDRSMGVHNMPYSIQILMDSIEALDSEFDTSTRPE